MNDELRLTKRSERCDWRKRLRDMVLAGGTVAAVGCATEPTDRRSETEAGLGSSGGSIGPIVNTGGAKVIGSGGRTEAGLGSGGGPQTEAGLGGSGGSIGPIVNTGGAAVIPCGNANPNPCICDRPLHDPVAAAQCAEEMECRSKGGIFTYIDTPNGACVGPEGGIIPLGHGDAGHVDAGIVEGGRRSADTGAAKD